MTDPLDGLTPEVVLQWVQTVMGLADGLVGTVFGITCAIILFGLVVRRIVGGVLAAAGVGKGGDVDSYSD